MPKDEFITGNWAIHRRFGDAEGWTLSLRFISEEQARTHLARIQPLQNVKYTIVRVTKAQNGFS